MFYQYQYLIWPTHRDDRWQRKKSFANNECNLFRKPLGKCRYAFLRKPLGNSVSGLCDMSGSVREWTQTPAQNSRVVRGGAWYVDQLHGLSNAGRFTENPAGTYHYNGFRCVR